MKKIIDKMLDFFKNNQIVLLSIILSFILSYDIVSILYLPKRLIFIIIFIQFYLIYLLLNKIDIFSKNSIKTILVACFISFFIVGAYSNNLFYQKDIISIIPSGEKNISSNANEIWVCSISNGYSSIINNNNLPVRDWIIQDGCMIYIGNNQEPLILPFNSNETLSFNLSSNDYSGKVVVNAFGNETKYDLYSPEYKSNYYSVSGNKVLNDAFSIIKNICVNFSLFVIVISLFMLYFKTWTYKLLFPLILVYSILGNMNSINKYVFIIGLALYVFALLESMKFLENNKKNFNIWKFLLFIIISLVVTFLFHGSQLFLSCSEIAFSASISSLFVFILQLFKIIILELFIMNCFDKISGLYKYNNNKRSTFFLYFGLSFAVLLVWGLLFYPGNFSPDSIDMWSQASVLSINDAHPALLTIILSWFYNFSHNPFCFIIFQNIYLSFTIAYIFYYLYKKGLNNKLLIILSLLIPTIPCIGMLNITLWKDVLYTISLLLLCFICYRIVFDEDDYSKKWYNILLILIVLLFVRAFRHNGLGPYLLSIILMLCMAIKRKSIRLFLVTMISIFISTIGLNYLYKLYNVNYSNISGSVYNSIIRNFGATIFYKGEISGEIYKEIESIGDYDFFKDNYYYNNIDYYFYNNNNSVDKWFNTVNKFDIKKIILLYLGNIINNPDVFIRDRIDSMDIMLNVTETPLHYPIFSHSDGVYKGTDYEQDLFDDYVDFPSENAEYLNNNILTKKIVRPLLWKTVNNKYTSAVLWRSGLYFVLYLILFLYLIIKKESNKLLVAIPIIGNTLTWFIVLNHPSVRYVYYLNMSFIFVMLLVLYNKEKKGGKKYE